MAVGNWLYEGSVYHKRFFPKTYVLKHKVFFICFPLSQIMNLKNSIFSVNSWNLLSFYSKDHGDRQGGDLWVWACQQLKNNGLDDSPTEIELQTTPRVFGYVFNPISYWYCYKGSEIYAVIAEVNNTFGETQAYIISPGTESYAKTLHVSPFFQIKGHYKFEFKKNLENSLAIIKYFEEDQMQLLATIEGRARKWTTGALLSTWLRHPLLTFATIYYIHFHALVLLIKRIPFYGKQGKTEA